MKKSKVSVNKRFVHLTKITTDKDDIDIIKLTKASLTDGTLEQDLLSNSPIAKQKFVDGELEIYLKWIINNKYTKSTCIKNHKYVIVDFYPKFYEKYIILVYAGYEPSVVFSMLGYPGRLFKAVNVTGDLAGLIIEYFNKPPNKMRKEIRENVLKKIQL